MVHRSAVRCVRLSIETERTTRHGWGVVLGGLPHTRHATCIIAELCIEKRKQCVRGRAHRIRSLLTLLPPPSWSCPAPHNPASLHPVGPTQHYTKRFEREKPIKEGTYSRYLPKKRDGTHRVENSKPLQSDAIWFGGRVQNTPMTLKTSNKRS